MTDGQTILLFDTKRKIELLNSILNYLLFPKDSFLVKGAITKLGFRDEWTKNTSEHCKN